MCLFLIIFRQLSHTFSTFLYDVITSFSFVVDSILVGVASLPPQSKSGYKTCRALGYSFKAATTIFPRILTTWLNKSSCRGADSVIAHYLDHYRDILLPFLRLLHSSRSLTRLIKRNSLSLHKVSRMVMVFLDREHNSREGFSESTFFSLTWSTDKHDVSWTWYLVWSKVENTGNDKSELLKIARFLFCTSLVLLRTFFVITSI